MIPVAVTFVYLLAWVMGCPDSWANIILGVPLRVSLDDINKEDFPQVWVGLI